FGMPQVRGTSDWTRCCAVIHVPANASTVQFGGVLWGPGKVWMDDFHVEVVPADKVQTTSDEKWRVFSLWGNYDLRNDAAVALNGHATLCLSCSTAARGNWGCIR